MGDYNIFEKFEQLTGVNIQDYMLRYIDFLRNDAPLLLSYYQGIAKSVSSTILSKFKLLEEEKVRILLLFQQHARQMNTVQYWELLEQIEDIDSKLSTLRKSPKWFRVAKSEFAFSFSGQADYVLRQNESLESISRNILLSNNPSDMWVDIALDNQLTEEGYTIRGGVPIKLELQDIEPINIESVVDIIDSDTIQGKDIQSTLLFSIEDGEGDIVVLSGKDTVKQSVDILSRLRRNDNPDLPTIGLQSGVIVGTTRSLLNFPVIIRQLSESFSTDDTLQGFIVKQIRFESDSLLVEFEVGTRVSEVQLYTSLI